jgi:hypothetical protein
MYITQEHHKRYVFTEESIEENKQMMKEGKWVWD